MTNLQNLIEVARKEFEKEFCKPYVTGVILKNVDPTRIAVFLEAKIKEAYREGATTMKDTVNLQGIKVWPPPVKGAGEGLGALAGTGMYMQYDADCKKHTQQIEEAERKAEAFLSTLNP